MSVDMSKFADEDVSIAISASPTGVLQSEELTIICTEWQAFNIKSILIKSSTS